MMVEIHCCLTLMCLCIVVDVRHLGQIQIRNQLLQPRKRHDVFVHRDGTDRTLFVDLDSLGVVLVEKHIIGNCLQHNSYLLYFNGFLPIFGLR